MGAPASRTPCAPLLACLALALGLALTPSSAGHAECSPGDAGFCAAGGGDIAGYEASAASSGKSITLFGNPMSSCTRRVLLALLEKGLPEFELKVLDLQKQDQKQPHYLAIQPFGKVPAIKDGDITVFESRAIIRYLAETYEGQGEPLLGRTRQERALVDTWLQVENNEFHPHAFTVFYEMVIGQRFGKSPDIDKVQDAVTKLEKVLDVYEDLLEERPFLAGGFVSLADISHVPLTAALWGAGYANLVEDRPSVNRWWRALASRPSWRRVVDGFP